MFAKLVFVFPNEDIGFAIAVFTAVNDDDLQHVSHLLSQGIKKTRLRLRIEPETGCE